MKERLPGATIEIDTPLGTKIPMRFGGDGLVTGEAGILGSYLGSSKDRGRWWVEADRLCIKWFRWFESQPRCMDIRLDGTRVFWRKEDGESGTATLADAAKPAPARLATATKPAVPVLTTPAPKKDAAQADTVLAAPLTPESAPVIDAPAAPEPAATPEMSPKAPEPQTASIVPSIVEQAAALAARFASPADEGSAALENQRMSVGALTTQPVILNPTPDAPLPGDTGNAPAVTTNQTAAVAIEQPAAQTAAPSVKNEIETAATSTAPIADQQAPLPSAPASKRPSQRVEKKSAPPEPSFRVARVAADDTLNIRSGPSEYTSVVGIISSSGRGVRMTGECRGDWCPIRHGATTGWVNRYYLAEDGPRSIRN